MKKVITYGTFDLLHAGHINILKRAKEAGDYLIVGVTSAEYDLNRGKLNVYDSIYQRMKNVEDTGFADEIIVEEFQGQKIIDIKKHNVDVFVIGDDWLGKFDYLQEYCDVIYLERTKDISSTTLRNNNHFLNIGMIGTGRIASRFVQESRYVGNVDIVSVWSRDYQRVKEFANTWKIKNACKDIDCLLSGVDAVYISSPHDSHYRYAKMCLEAGKHVLVEKPMALDVEHLMELKRIANASNLQIVEAVKTAFCNGFNKLVAFTKSGIIGDIVQIDANFTKLIDDRSSREFSLEYCGGSHNELMTYPLLAACKILGTDVMSYNNVRFFDSATRQDRSYVDIYSHLHLQYSNAIANLNVGIGAKKEGDLIITGTKGYIYVPAPWWLTKSFYVKHEDPSRCESFTYKFEGDGLRYEISEFALSVQSGTQCLSLSIDDSLFFSEYISCDYKQMTC